MDVGERVATRARSRFSSRLHEPRTAAILGIALGVTFSVCMVTGLLSHVAQDPTSWFPWPNRPAGLYRVTQGVHTITGFVSIPVLLAKLWVVAPKLWDWPPMKSVAHALERAALLPLVGGGLFMLFSGVANVARWYPWSFYFPAAHYVVAWVTIGAMVIHLGAKAAVVKAELFERRVAEIAPTEAEVTTTRVLAADRRAFLGGVAATAGVVFLATAGNTVTPLSDVAALAQRKPNLGPQGLPVNKSARDAGVIPTATSADYRLVIEADGTERSFTLTQLRAMPQRTAVLPIACVEGWSTSARWRGISVVELLGLEGTRRKDLRVRVESFQKGGRYNHSELRHDEVLDPDTLLALELNGEELHLDHGFPVRLIGPNRPGVDQTKWVRRVVLL